MPIIYTNTVFFDFANTPELTELECHRWLRNTFQLQVGDAEIIDFNRYKKTLNVKFTSEEIFETFINKVGQSAYYWRDGESYEIVVRNSKDPYAQDQTKVTLVRIKYIPGEVKDFEMLKKELETFG